MSLIYAEDSKTEVGSERLSPLGVRGVGETMDRLGGSMPCWWFNNFILRKSTQQTDGKAYSSKVSFQKAGINANNVMIQCINYLPWYRHCQPFLSNCKSKHLSVSSETERKHSFSRDHPNSVCGRDTGLVNCWPLITTALLPTQVGRRTPRLFIPKWDYGPTVHMRYFTARKGEFLQSSRPNKKVPPSYSQGAYREQGSGKFQFLGGPSLFGGEGRKYGHV